MSDREPISASRRGGDPLFRLLLRSVRLLAAFGGLALASTGECEPLFLGVFLSFFLIGFKIESLPTLANAVGIAQPFLAALIFAVGLADFFFLSNSFLLSVAHFLLSLQGLRLLTLRTSRDNLGSVLLSSLMVLSASTLAIEWTFFGVLLLFLPLVIWTLMLHTIMTQAEEASVARRELGAGASSSIGAFWPTMSPALRTSSGVAFLVATLCCAFVFITFPRFNFQGFRGQFLQPVHKTGFSNQIDLDKGGRIYTDDAVVMRVEVPDEDRGAWTGYVRGAALEVFDGRAWRRGNGSVDRVYQNGHGETSVSLGRRLLGERLRQSVYLESMDTSLLFAVPTPAALRIDRPFLEMGADGSIQRRSADGWRIRYDVISFVDRNAVLTAANGFGASVPRAASGPKTAAAPAVSHPGSTDFVRRYRSSQASSERDLNLMLPDPALPRVEELAHQLTKGTSDPIESARRIAEHLSTNYRYSLDMGRQAPTVHPIERFLFDRKEGHCEYFASSMAIMLRYLGIPARVGTGFLSHEWNSRGHYYVVRMKHAHAWVEVYDDNQGWMLFDPSPPGADLDDTNETLRRFEEMWDFLNLRWNRYILSYDFEKQVAIVRTVTQTSGQISLRIGNVMDPIREWAARWSGRSFTPSARTPPLIPLAGWLVLLAVAVVGLRRRRRAGPGRHVWFYGELVDFLRRSGAELRPSSTIWELARSVRGTGAAEPEVQALAEAYYRLRFDPAAELSSEEDRNLRARVRRLRRLSVRPSGGERRPPAAD